MKKHWSAYTDVPPPASDRPADQLRHFLACFPDSPDAELVKMSTSNVYDEGLVTGLTFGTLRALVKMLELYEQFSVPLAHLCYVASGLHKGLHHSTALLAAINQLPEGSDDQPRPPSPAPAPTHLDPV